MRTGADFIYHINSLKISLALKRRLGAIFVTRDIASLLITEQIGPPNAPSLPFLSFVDFLKTTLGLNKYKDGAYIKKKGHLKSVAPDDSLQVIFRERYVSKCPTGFITLHLKNFNKKG